MFLAGLKAVLPVAGLGTRMLPATKEQPKEMLPVFARTSNGELCVKPLLQLVFEYLYGRGVREFIFVVGRGKRSVEDHFTPDNTYLTMLKNSKPSLAQELEKFYEMINNSVITWVNQPEPKGFGHAVLVTKHLVGENPFIVHAGDTYIISQSKNNDFTQKMIKAFREEDAGAVILLQEVENPKQYGVAEVKQYKEEILKVMEVVEKPENPKTNLAIMPIYIFKPAIFKALQTTKPGKGGEIQLTDAIQTLIQEGQKVLAIKLHNETRLDIGMPQQYWEALLNSYSYSTENKPFLNPPRV